MNDFEGANLIIKDKMLSAGFLTIPVPIQRMTEMSPVTKDVFMALIGRARPGGGGKICPSIKTIASDIGMSETTTRRALHELMTINQKGMQIRVEEAGKQEKKSNKDWAKIKRLTSMTDDEKKDVGILRRHQSKGKPCHYEIVVPEWIWAKYSEDNPSQVGRGTPPKLGVHPSQVGSRSIVREGDKMNTDGVGLPSEVPHRPDPSSILDARSKATKLSREAKDKIARKKFAREQEISTSGTLPLDRWRGTAFYKYLMALCAKHSIPIGDMIEHSKSPPEKFAHMMNDILRSCELRQLSKQDLAHMLEGLTSEWKCGASGSFSGDGKIYTNALREKIDRLVSMYGPKRQSVPEVEIETIPLDELYLKKPETEVKKEDNA